jgi:hypothetical protein
MHNCKATRNQLIEAAIEHRSSEQSVPLPPELEECPACGEEFAALRSLLRVADQAIESSLPSESYWSGYHTRLRQSLASEPSPASRPSAGTSALALPRNLFTTSIRVPVPAAALLILLFGVSIVFATHWRRETVGEPLSDSPSVVTKTVEVPVIQERTVTRVVYRDRSRRASSDIAQIEKTAQSAAKATNRPHQAMVNTPISLVGFKPTNDPKLTIIKGSYRDEK